MATSFMSLSHYPQILQFLNYLKFEKRYSQYTFISYKTDVEQFFAFAISRFDAPKLNEISGAFVRSWLAKLKEEKVTSKTINRKISSLNSFFRFLITAGVIQKTPMETIVTPKVGKRLPVFIKEKEIEKLFENTKFTEDWKGRTERLILQLFYNTGMRLSELINLKDNQVDFSYQQLKVVGKGNKERIIPVSEKLLKQLQDYILEKPVKLEGVPNFFVNKKGKALYPKYVYRLVDKHLSRVTTIQTKSPHVLRHTFATHLMNNDAELNAVKELLGHASLAATQVYTHNTIEKLKRTYKKAHPKA